MFRKRKESQGPLMALSLAMLVTPVLSPMAALAQARPGATGGGSPSSPGSGSANLDLSAASATLAAKNHTPVNIQVGGAVHNGTVSGGTTLTILPGQLVTPAQYVAVFEALRGNQSLLVNNQGVASGGSFRLNSTSVHDLAGLLVPAGVSLTAVGYNSTNPLSVSGNTSILGSMFAVQTAPNIVSVLNLANLTIGQGGLLSGSLPAGVNMPGLYSSAGMNLNIAGNLLNQGTITTPGTLNIVSTGSISNISAASQAVMAAQNINISVGSGNIVNSGLIQAAGNLNFNTINPTGNLNINNTNGVLQALSSLNPVSGILEGGVLNLRSDDANIELGNVSVSGGTIDAGSAVNVYGKDMSVHVDEIKGTLNMTGSVSHVSVNKGDLTLGKQILSGDPTYYNTGGDITIADLTTVGGDLAIVASGDILTTGNTIISTTSADFSVFLSAGYNFTAVPDNSVGSFPSNDPGDSASLLTFDGTSNANKSINPGGNAMSIHASGTGAVTLIASGDINLGSGSIDTASGKILTISNNLNATNATLISSTGDIELNSGMANTTGITVLDGTVSSSPTVGSASAGTLNLPFINAGGNLSVNSLGTVNLGASTSATGMTIVGGTIDGQSGSISGQTGSILIYTTSNGTITNLGNINSAGDVYVGTNDGSTATADNVGLVDSISTSGAVYVLANKSITSPSGKSIDGQAVTVQSGGDVLMSGTAINASLPVSVSSNGILNVGDVTSVGGITIDNGSSTKNTVTGKLSSASTTGTAGDITVSGGLDISTDVIDSSSTNGNGGAVSLNGNAGVTSTGLIDSHSSNGAGGSVTVASTDGISIAGGINATGSGAGNQGGVIDLAVSGSTPTIQIVGDVDNSNDSSTAGGYISIAGKGTGALALHAVLGSDYISGQVKSSDYVSISNPNGIQIENNTAVFSEVGVALEATAGSIQVGSNGAVNAPLVVVSAAGDVGSKLNPFNVAGPNPSLAVLTNGSVYVASSADLVIDGVTVGSLSLTGISSVGDVSIKLPVASTLQLNAPISSTGPNANISLVSDTIDFATSGTLIDAGASGSVVLAPSTSNMDITVGGTSNYFDTASLTQITTGSLQFGNTGYSGNITLGDTISNSGLFNIAFATTGKFDSNTFTIDGGDKSVSISADTVSTDGISATTGDINLSGANGVTINGAISTNLGNVTLTSGPGDITGNGNNVSAGGNVVVDPGTGKVVNLGNVTASGDIFIGTSDGSTSKASGIQVGKLDNSGGTGKVVVLTQTGGISTNNILSTSDITVKALSSTTSGDVTVGAIDNSTGTGAVVVDAASGNMTLAAITSNSTIDIGNLTGANMIDLGGTIDSSGGSGHVSILTGTGYINGAQDIKSGDTITLSAPQGAIGDDTPLGNLTANSDVTVSAKLSVSVGGISTSNAGDAGDVSVQGGGTVIIAGNVDATGVNSGGKVQIISTTDTIEVDGFIDNTSTLQVQKNDILLQQGGLGTLTIGSVSSGPGNLGQVTSDGKLTVNAAAVDFAASTSVGQLLVNADSTTVDSGVVVQADSITILPTIIGTPGPVLTLDNSGSLNALNGNITVTGAFGQDVTLTGDGNGTFSVINGKSINITANGDTKTPGNLNFGPGNMTFFLGNGSSPGATANFITQNTLNLTATYSFPNDFSKVNVTFNTFNGNPADFDLQGQPNSSLNITVVGGKGTIANSAGDIDLSSLATLSFTGPIAFLASGNIVNNGVTPLTVQSHGNSLTMIAGIDFGPPTKGTQGPDAQPYTLSGTSKGGSINIGNVDLDSSDLGTGGDIFLVASTGTDSGSGAVTVGAITSNGTTSSGSVKVYGSSVQINGIDSSSLGVAGNVVITSSDKITISNPGQVKVQDGIITGGTLLPSSTLTGTVSLGNDINAGTGSVTILGGDFNSSGSISANALTMKSASGNILGQAGGTLNTVIGTKLDLTASGKIDVSNTNNVSLAADAGTTFSFNNTGNVTIDSLSTVKAGTSINILLGTTDTLTIDGNVTSSSGTVTLEAGSIDSTTTTNLVTAQTLNITSDTDHIGATNPINTAVTTSMVVRSGGSVNIVNTGTLAGLDLIAAQSQPGGVSFTNKSGNLTLSNDLAANGTVDITLDPTFTFANAGFKVSSTDNAITIVTDKITFTAPGTGSAFDAGTAAVNIYTASAGTAINLGAAAATGLNLTSALLNSVNASTLNIGKSSNSGNVSLTSAVDISTQNYALVIDQEGGTASFDTKGFQLSLGSNNATVKVAGTVSLDKVTTAGTNTLLFSGSAVTLNGAVGTDGDDITLSASTGDIVSAGSGQVTAGTLNLAAGGNIGSSIKSLSTQVSSALTATSSGDMFISNNAVLTGLKATSTKGSITFQNTGDLTLMGTGVTAAKAVTLSVSAGSTIDFDGSPVTGTTTVKVVADSIANAGTFDAGTGLLIFNTANPATQITVGSGSTGLVIDEATINSAKASKITIGSTTNFGNLVVGSPLNLSLNGDIELLQGDNGTLSGSFQGAGQTISVTGGNILVSTTKGSISTGLITDLTGAVTLQTGGGNITLDDQLSIPDANTINILAGGVGTGATTGSLLFGSPLTGTLQVSAEQALDGSGGKVALRANNFMNTAAGANNIAAVAIDVSASGANANGGTASFERTAPTSAFAPTSSVLTLNISAGTTTGKLGSATISNNGDLTYDPTKGVIITNSPSTSFGGASITLTAGNIGAGNLLVTGNLAADGKAAPGGSITLNSNSTTSFTLGSTTAKNGTKGTLSVAGTTPGDIKVTNRGGGITFASTTGLPASISKLTFDTTGAKAGTLTISKPLTATTSITLTAGGTGTINPGANLLTAPTVALTAQTGAITAKVNTSTVSASTTGPTGTAAVSLTSTGTGLLTVNPSSAIGTFTLTHAGAITTAGTVAGTSVTIKSTSNLPGDNITLGGNVTATSSTGSVSITSPKASILTTAGLITGKTVTLSAPVAAGSVGSPLKISAASLSETAADAFIENTAFGSSAITVTSAKATNVFSLKSTAPIVLTSALTNAKNVLLDTVSLAGANGNITVNGSVGTTTAATAITILSSQSILGSGTLSTKAGASGVILQTGTAGNFGTSTAPIKTNTDKITVNNSTSGLINLSDASTTAVTFPNALVAGGIVKVATSGPATFSKAVTAGNSGNGSVTITTKGTTVFSGAVSATGTGTLGSVSITQTGGGTLQLNGGSASNLYSVSTTGAGINVNPSGIISATNITMKTTGANSGITIGSQLLAAASGGAVNLTATGTGNISGSQLVQGGTITFTTGTGNVGTALGNDLPISATTVSVKSTGAVFLSNQGLGALTVAAANPNNKSFQLISTSPVTMTATLSTASDIDIQSKGGLVLNGATLGGSKANNISLTNITTGDISGKAVVTTSATGGLTLSNTAATGNITGTSTTVGLKISTTKVNSMSAIGLINVNDTATTAMTFGAISGSKLTLTTTGNTTFTANVTSTGTGGADGNISIIQTTGLLSVANGVKIDATGTTAQVLLQEKANAATSGISMGTGSQISTHASNPKPAIPGAFPRPGQVSLIIGSTIPAPTNNTAPTGIAVVVSGTASNADAYFGTAPLSIIATGTTVNVVNKTAVQMQAGTSAKITLNNATITADPPASEAALAAPAAAATLHSIVAPQSRSAASSAFTIASPVASTSESINVSNNSTAFSMPVQTTNINNTVNPSISKMLQGGVSANGTADSDLFGTSNVEAAFSSDKDFGFTANTSTIGDAHKVVDLDKGSVLFAPFVDTVVKTPFGDVEIAAKSVALVFSSAHGTAVYNLDDQHRDAVHVKAGEQRMHIAPGRHLTITTAGVKDFGQVNAVESIAYRNIKEQVLENGMKVFSAEYSIPSAIASIKPLKSLCNSQHPEARKLSNHLMKTVASMLQLNRNGERYQQVFRPRMAAFNNQ